MTKPKKFRIEVVEFVPGDATFGPRLEDLLNKLNAENYSIELRPQSQGTYLILGVHNEPEQAMPTGLPASLSGLFERMMGGGNNDESQYEKDWEQDTRDIFHVFEARLNSASHGEPDKVKKHELQGVLQQAVGPISHKYTQAARLQAVRDLKGTIEKHAQTCAHPQECGLSEFLTVIVSLLESDLRLSTH